MLKSPVSDVENINHGDDHKENEFGKEATGILLFDVQYIKYSEHENATSNVESESGIKDDNLSIVMLTSLITIFFYFKEERPESKCSAIRTTISEAADSSKCIQFIR